MSRVSEFFNKTSFVLLDPSNKAHFSPKLAWLTTILLGIFTLGLAQGLSGIWRHFNPHEQNDTHAKINQIFKKSFHTNKPSQKSVDNPSSLIEIIEKNLNFSPLEKLRKIQNLIEPKKTEEKVFLQQLKNEACYRIFMNLHNEEVEAILHDLIVIKTEQKGSFGKTSYASLTINLSQDKNWPLAFLNTLSKEQEDLILEKLGSSILTLTQAEAVGPFFIKNCNLKGLKSKTQAITLLNPIFPTRNLSQILSDLPEDGDSFSMQFSNPSELSKSLEILTRTVNTREILHFTPIEDLSFVANLWEKRLESSTNPVIKENALILSAFIKALKNPQKTNGEFSEEAYNATEQPVCFIKVEPNQRLTCILIALPPLKDELNPTIIQFFSKQLENQEFVYAPESKEDLLNNLEALSSKDSKDSKFTPEIDHLKLFNEMIKNLLGTHYPHELLSLKLKRLMNFHQNYPDWVRDPSLVSWLRDVLVNLQTSYEKLLSTPEGEILNQQIDLCFKEVLKAEKAIKQLAPLDPKKIGSINTIKHCLNLSPSLNVNLKNDLRDQASSKSTINPQLLPSIDFSKPSDALGIVDDWINHIDALTKTEDFDGVSRAAMIFLDRFRDRQIVESFLNGITPAEISAWSQRLEKISSSLLIANFALERSCTPHTHLVALLRNFEIMQDLLHKDPTSNFSKMHFTMEWLMIGMRDPYLDWGTSNVEVLNICSRLMNKPGRATDFASTYADPSNPSPTFLYTQQAFRVLNIALMPANTLISIDLSVSDISNRKDFLNNQAKVKKSLKKSTGILQFEKSSGQNYHILKPYDVHFYAPSASMSYNNMYFKSTSGSISGFFEQKNPVKKRRIRTDIVEAVVGIHDQGAGLDGSTTSYRDFRYQGKHTTQQDIQDELSNTTMENCSPSLFKKLQLMQTAPEDRVQNTLYIFAENSSLLNDPDWQRVLELNLFRYGFLSQKLSIHPGFADSLAAHLLLLTNQALQRTLPLGFITTLLSTTRSIMEAFPPHHLEIYRDALNNVIHQETQLLESLDQQLKDYEEMLIDGKTTEITHETQGNYRSWLLVKTNGFGNFSEEELILFFQRYLFFTSFPRLNVHEDALVKIWNHVDNLLPQIATILKEDPKKLGLVTRLRLKGSPNDFEPDSNGILWRIGSHVINLQTGGIKAQINQTKALPLSVKEELGDSISAEAKRSLYIVSSQPIDGLDYDCYHIEEKGKKFKFFLREEEKPIFLMKMSDGDWYQKQNNPISHQSLDRIPRAFQSLKSWTNLGKKIIRFIDEKEIIHFEGNWDTEKGTISNLVYIAPLKKYKVLNAANHNSLKALERLDQKNGILLLQDEEGSHTVFYPDLNLKYTWNPEALRWESTLHPGFYISDKDIRDYLHPLAQNSSIMPEVFSPSFFDYHLLENNTQSSLPKLVLSGREYTPHLEKETTPLHKRRREQFPKALSPTNPMLFTYEIDPERGLCCYLPEGYLYLSYLLYTQGKYPQAALAMKQAFNRMQGLTKQSQEILNFFQRWPNKEPNALALLTQLSLYAVEQNQMEQVSATEAVSHEIFLEQAIHSYENYVKQEKAIDPQFVLTSDIHDKFKYLKRRCYPWINEQLQKKIPHLDLWQTIFRDSKVQADMKVDSNDSVKGILKNGIRRRIAELNRSLKDSKEPETILQEIATFTQFQGKFLNEYETCKTAMDFCCLDFKDIQFYVEHGLLAKEGKEPFFTGSEDKRIKTEALLKWGLDREIQLRTSQLPPQLPRSIEKMELIQGVPVFTDYEKYFIKAESKSVQSEKIQKHLNQLEKVFKDQPASYLAEMAKHIFDDAKYYCAMIGEPLSKSDTVEESQPIFANIKDEASLKLLQQQIKTQEIVLETQVKELQAKIISSFHLGESIDTLLRRLKGQDPVVIDLFTQGRLCFGLDDWTPLIAKGILTSDETKKVADLYKNYLVQNSLRKQMKKANEQIDSLAANKEVTTNIEVQKLISLLQTKRYYDVEKDPFAAALLLIEDELGIICSKNQINHFFKMITHEGAFMQEAWGEGKTFLLRHLIALFHANGAYASSHLTHKPLFNGHHGQLKETVAGVFGQQASRMESSRKSPVDGIAIRREHLKLLKTVQEKGRMDLTLNDLISTTHNHILNIIHLNKDSSKDDIDAIHSANQYLNALKKLTVIGSDELDQLFSPDQEHNYSTGIPVFLPSQVYEPALEFLRLINSADYAPFHIYFTLTNPTEMSLNQRLELVQKLAKDLAIKYPIPGIKEEDLIKYWCPMPDQITREEFSEHQRIHQIIDSQANPELHQSIQIFLSTILPFSFNSKVGVDFCRSEDGIHTKPSPYSGKPDEPAQHGSPHLTVWYTCLDFMKEGIEEKSQHAAIATYVGRLKETAEKQRKGTAHRLDETSEGEAFFEHYHLSLSKITERDYEAIAKSINTDLTLKIHFLKKANFEHSISYTKRLMGNGKQAAHSVGTIWGTSGNAERALTLPSKVNLDVMKQKGTAGRIFYNLIKDYEEGDIVTYDRSLPLSDCIQSKVSKGSAFIDLGPFFEGKTPEQCVDQLMKSSTDQTPIRYINSKGDVMIRLLDGNDRRDDGTMPLDSFKTLYCHCDCRGRDLLLPPNTTHVMSLSSNTWTEFGQGGMRVRGWGKTQKIQYLIDTGLEKKLQDPSLAEMDLPVKIVVSLLQNEVDKLQRLHTLATRQEIMAVGDAAIKSSLCNSERNSLLPLKTLCADFNYLEQNAELNFAAASCPKYPESSFTHFETLIEKEKTRLTKLKEAILQHPGISKKTKLTCVETTDKALVSLDPQILIMNPKYLSPTISSVDDTIETVEVEEEQVQEVAAEIEEQASGVDEVQVEKEIAEERNVEEEIEEPRSQKRLMIWIANIDEPSQIIHKKVERIDLLDEVIYATENTQATGFPYGFWSNGGGQRLQLLADSVLLVCNPKTGSVELIMGTVKDADLSFENYNDLHRKTGYISIHYKFGDQRPLSQALKDFDNEDLIKKAKNKIVVAKLIYAKNIRFTEDEKAILKEKFLQLPNNTKYLLEDRLATYLNKHVPIDERQALKVVRSF